MSPLDEYKAPSATFVSPVTAELLPPRIVFLDIDGVLQPCSSQERFRHDLDALRGTLATEVDPGYRDLDKYDIAAVKYDWKPVAVQNLKKLCEEARASIVVSSSWRDDKTLEMLKLLFRIHDLDDLILDMTPSIGARDMEIVEFLIAHPEIKRFVILDDGHRRDLGGRFPGEFVETTAWLDDEALRRALAVLRRGSSVHKRRTRLARFDALLRGDPGLTHLSLSIEDIGILRRARRCSAGAFLGSLCDAVERCPNLESLTVRGLERDFTYDERRKDDPLARLASAARKNPAIHRVDIQELDRW